MNFETTNAPRSLEGVFLDGSSEVNFKAEARHIGLSARNREKRMDAGWNRTDASIFILCPSEVLLSMQD